MGLFRMVSEEGDQVHGFPRQECAPQVGVQEIGLTEVHVRHEFDRVTDIPVDAHEVGAPKVGVTEVGGPETASLEQSIDPTLRFQQVEPAGPCPAQVGVFKLALSENRAAQIGPAQIGPGEVAAVKGGLCQIGVAEVGPAQVDLTEADATQVDTGPDPVAVHGPGSGPDLGCDPTRIPSWQYRLRWPPGSGPP